MGDIKCKTGTIPQISMGWYEKIIVSTIMVEGVMQDATRMVRELMYNGNDAGLVPQLDDKGDYTGTHADTRHESGANQAGNRDDPHVLLNSPTGRSYRNVLNTDSSPVTHERRRPLQDCAEQQQTRQKGIR
jgi:hypothetical protein